MKTSAMCWMKTCGLEEFDAGPWGTKYPAERRATSTDDVSRAASAAIAVTPLLLAGVRQSVRTIRATAASGA